MYRNGGIIMGLINKMYTKKGRKTIVIVIALILVVAMVIPLFNSIF